MDNQVNFLLQRLSRVWGNPLMASEWDGRDGNGGKGSQRFWEYHWAIRQMPERHSFVLDVGSGGTQFFPKLLQQGDLRVKMIDPVLNNTTIEAFVGNGVHNGYSFDWVTCISVLEHVEDKPKFCAALDSIDAPIAMTFESGPGGVEHKDMYRCFDAFTNHYLDKMELCPIWADNSAPDKWRPMGVVFLPFTR